MSENGSPTRLASLSSGSYGSHLLGHTFVLGVDQRPAHPPRLRCCNTSGWPGGCTSTATTKRVVTQNTIINAYKLQYAARNNVSEDLQHVYLCCCIYNHRLVLQVQTCAMQCLVN